MIPIGFDPVSGTLVITDNGVFPAQSLTASITPLMPDHVQIDDLAGRGVQSVFWAEITSLDGSHVPSSMADALAYLQGEFTKGRAARAIVQPYPLTGAASFTINHGLPYVPSATVVDPDGVEVDADVAHAPGLTTLTFAQPFTGTLYLG